MEFSRQPSREPDGLDEYTPQLIYVVDADRTGAGLLAQQLRLFGYQALPFADIREMRDAYAEMPADALILDISGDAPALFAEWAAFRQDTQRVCPVVFVSASDTLDLRLAAVRAGSQGFFTKPAAVDRLAENLALLTERQDKEAYRILIMDDDPAIARLNRAILESARLQVRLIEDPENLLEAVADFQPELILMDMYMPGCQGDELARVVRQQQPYPPIPLIYVSGEFDREKQLAAIRSGGEDFLTKPVQPRHLLAAVFPLAGRYRMMRAAMLHDNLTGLLNYSSLIQRLRQLLKNAEHTGQPLAFALVDIDGLSAINQQYGEAAGDRVIANLCLVLQHKLPAHAVLGRYEGDCFTVVLPRNARQAAGEALADLLAGFAEIDQRAGGTLFRVSASAGVTHFPDEADVPGLIESATRALRKAKQAGRNRVETA